MIDKDIPTRRKFIKTVGVGAGIATLAGCTADPDTGDSNGEFVYAKSSELTHMDQHAITDGTLSQLRLCFDYLVGYKKEDPTEITPHLASDYHANEEATEFVFELREGIEFDDGTPFDSYAVKRSLERAKEIQASQAQPYNWLDSVEETGDYEVTIHCAEPNAPTVAQLTASTAAIYNPTVIDEHWDEDDYGHEYFSENVHGLGPYRLDEWVPGDQWVAVRKENHWREELDDLPEDIRIPDNANIDTYRKVTIREEQTQRQELTRGDIDMGENLTWTNVEQVTQQENVELHDAGPDLRAKFVFMNTKRDPTDDIDFRKALSYAVDYESMTSELVGAATPMGTPWMEGIWPRVTEGQYEFNSDLAMDHLDASSYDGREIELRYPQSPENETYGEALAANFNEIGVNVDARAVEWANLNEQWTNPESAPEMSMFTGFCDYSDPDAHTSRYNSDNHPPNGFNVSFFEDDRVDEIIQEGARNADRSQREELYTEMQEIIIDEAPMLWLFQSNWARPYNTAVTNMSYTVGELNYLRVYDFHKESR